MKIVMNITIAELKEIKEYIENEAIEKYKDMYE